MSGKNNFLLNLILLILLIFCLVFHFFDFFWFRFLDLLILNDLNKDVLSDKYSLFIGDDDFQEFKQRLKEEGLSSFVYAPGGNLPVSKLKASIDHFYLYFSTPETSYFWDMVRGNPLKWSWWQFELIKKQTSQIDYLEHLLKNQKQEILELKTRLKNISDLK